MGSMFRKKIASYSTGGTKNSLNSPGSQPWKFYLKLLSVNLENTENLEIK